jgi:hypothetical protein
VKKAANSPPRALVRRLRWSLGKENDTMHKSARLALFTACSLAFACTSADERAAKKKLEQPAASAAHIEHRADKPLLAATVKELPPSIVDGPKLESPKPETPNPERPKVDMPDVESHEKLMVELGDKEPAEVDYDRPLDPSEVKVDRFVLSTDVQDREPVDASETFPSDTKKIFAFVQLANPSAPYAFRIHFEKLEEEPKPYGIELTVPTAPRYRTWAWTAIKREPGLYKAVLRTLDGKDIDSREFTITE